MKRVRGTTKVQALTGINECLVRYVNFVNVYINLSCRLLCRIQAMGRPAIISPVTLLSYIILVRETKKE